MASALDGRDAPHIIDVIFSRTLAVFAFTPLSTSHVTYYAVLHADNHAFPQINSPQLSRISPKCRSVFEIVGEDTESFTVAGIYQPVIGARCLNCYVYQRHDIQLKENIRGLREAILQVGRGP